ncbi:hypothetical protein AB4Z17_25925 [Paenibacillus sp. TAF43_2]|uniref:hypothetical protein n=1 Tax=Paenibacillus sp. TAF43_2 TaxID=3233069 RepID=UPI003F94E442
MEDNKELEEITEHEDREGESPLIPSEEEPEHEEPVESVGEPEDEPIFVPEPVPPVVLPQEDGTYPPIEHPAQLEPEHPAAPSAPSDKMLVFHDGNYEVGYWLHSQSYPDSDMPYYILDLADESDKALAVTIEQLFPFVSLDIEDGKIVNVTEREKTQEEIDRENAPAPKTAEQIRIEQLEDENAMMALEVANTNIRLDQSEQAQADLMLTLVLEGVL